MEFPKLQKCVDDYNAAVADGTILYVVGKLSREFDDAKRECILEAIEAGYPSGEIMQFFNISKQRLEQYIHPENDKARKVVAQAIKTKKLTRLPCRACGDPKSEAHHEDYSKPLEVVWLCKKHHAVADAERRARLASASMKER